LAIGWEELRQRHDAEAEPPDGVHGFAGRTGDGAVDLCLAHEHSPFVMEFGLKSDSQNVIWAKREMWSGLSAVLVSPQPCEPFEAPGFEVLEVLETSDGRFAGHAEGPGGVVELAGHGSDELVPLAHRLG